VSAADAQALAVTLRLAAVTTLLLLVLGTPLAWWLARTKSRAALVVESLVALPLVLPPTVLGFYLLVLMGPRGLVGEWVAALGLPSLVFSFWGLVVGVRLTEAAATLRAGPLDAFFSVAVPLARRGFFSAITLTFAHTVGEFGVVLMVGGNIPGATRVLSIAIYDHAEAMNHAAAHVLAGGLLLASFAALVALNLLKRNREAVA
jgi:molybdate transport system permease protein